MDNVNKCLQWTNPVNMQKLCIIWKTLNNALAGVKIPTWRRLWVAWQSSIPSFWSTLSAPWILCAGLIFKITSKHQNMQKHVLIVSLTVSKFMYYRGTICICTYFQWNLFFVNLAREINIFSKRKKTVYYVII